MLGLGGEDGNVAGPESGRRRARGVAIGSLTVRSGSRSSSPSLASAARWAPRATRTTSWPCSKRRPPMAQPIAPAPRIT